MEIYHKETIEALLQIAKQLKEINHTLHHIRLERIKK